MTKKTTTMQDEVLDSAQRIWRAGLGALAMAEEEGTKFFNNLVKKGEDFEQRGKKQFDKVQDSVEEQFEGVRDRAENAFGKIGKSFDSKVAEALQRLGVPSRMEIQKLTKRVEALTQKVDELNKPTTSKKTTTRSRKTA
jgi:poly(hydroxyalkanoate) granule-associated protein